jgi:hypothetical protein
MVQMTLLMDEDRFEAEWGHFPSKFMRRENPWTAGGPGAILRDQSNILGLSWDAPISWAPEHTMRVWIMRARQDRDRGRGGLRLGGGAPSPLSEGRKFHPALRPRSHAPGRGLGPMRVESGSSRWWEQVNVKGRLPGAKPPHTIGGSWICLFRRSY